MVIIWVKCDTWIYPILKYYKRNFNLANAREQQDNLSSVDSEVKTVLTYKNKRLKERVCEIDPVNPIGL